MAGTHYGYFVRSHRILFLREKAVHCHYTVMGGLGAEGDGDGDKG